MSRSIRKVALLLRRMTGYHYQVLCGIRRYAVGFSHWRWQGITPDNSALAALAQWRPHGVIGMIGTPTLVAALKKLRIPTVDVSRWLNPPPGAQVTADCLAVGELAANYFLHRGFKRFAFVGSAREYCAVERRT